MIVDQLLQSVGDDAEILPIETPNGFPDDRLQEGLLEFGEKQFNQSVKHTRRILPDDLFDAFFVARISKVGAVI